MHYDGLFAFKPGYTHRDSSNTTESVPTMKMWSVLLAMGLLTACLPSGKMEGGGYLGLEGKDCDGLEQEMPLGYYPHHLLYI